MDSQCVLGICYIGFAVSVVLNTCTVKDWVTTDDGRKEDSSHRSLCAVRAEDHINSPYIMSSGKSTESTIFYAERSDHAALERNTKEEQSVLLWDTRPCEGSFEPRTSPSFEPIVVYTRPFGSSTASDGAHKCMHDGIGDDDVHHSH